MNDDDMRGRDADGTARQSPVAGCCCERHHWQVEVSRCSPARTVLPRGWPNGSVPPPSSVVGTYQAITEYCKYSLYHGRLQQTAWIASLARPGLGSTLVSSRPVDSPASASASASASQPSPFSGPSLFPPASAFPSFALVRFSCAAPLEALARVLIDTVFHRAARLSSPPNPLPLLRTTCDGLHPLAGPRANSSRRTGPFSSARLRPCFLAGRRPSTGLPPHGTDPLVESIAELLEPPVIASSSPRPRLVLASSSPSPSLSVPVPPRPLVSPRLVPAPWAAPRRTPPPPLPAPCSTVSWSGRLVDGLILLRDTSASRQRPTAISSLLRPSSPHPPFDQYLLLLRRPRAMRPGN
ncbi:hypothetical protein DCS_04828 [Drechmeria coniospora]|uniref:Uncharacterized protein n=1 Tax=Drechmeria coniospora TaxID=98403 RepID=A0A151GL32_DRECN|nr:hypothetical protein DCS_04828 [Drechmeria coniospora]KYK57815.1 hypothetical protein DCS_04828 [Drechmeria coniospora]